MHRLIMISAILFFSSCHEGSKKAPAARRQLSFAEEQNDKLLTKTMIAKWRLDTCVLSMEASNRMLVTPDGRESKICTWQIRGGKLIVSQAKKDLRTIDFPLDKELTVLFVSDKRLELLEEGHNKLFVATRVN